MSTVRSSRGGAVSGWLLLLLAAAYFLLPLLALARFSFQRVPVALLGWHNLFDNWTLDGFRTAWEGAPFATAFFNSFYIAALVTIIAYMGRSGLISGTSPAGDDKLPSDRPRYRISNLSNAVYESKVEGGTVHSSLTRGLAAFHVEKLAPGQRFLLTLPDGDLEVRGTRLGQVGHR